MKTALTLFIAGACLAGIARGLRTARRREARSSGLAFAGLGALLAFGFVVAASELLIAQPWLDVPLVAVARRSVLPGLAGLLGLAFVWFASRLKLASREGAALHAGWIALPLAVFSGISLIGPHAQQPPQPTPTAEPPTPTEVPLAVQIERSLPDGYRVQPVLQLRGRGAPTSTTFGEDGALYVAAGNSILRAPHADGKGSPDPVQIFAEDIPQALGLAERDGVVYVSSEGTLLALTDRDGDGRSDQRRTLIEGLPHFVYTVHSNNGLAFDQDGWLYMGLGGTSDHGPERHPIAGSILRVDVESGEHEVYARGLRNPYDLAFCPDGSLFATDNGPDKPDGEELVYRPPDEVNWIREGRHYGYPDHFGYPPPWSDTEPPVSLLPYSSVATGITCYAPPGGAGQLPHARPGDLFVTLWGSTQIPEQTGQILVRVILRRTPRQTIGEATTFAEGFIRPIDVVQDSAGALWVADYGAQQVFRLSFER